MKKIKFRMKLKPKPAANDDHDYDESVQEASTFTILVVNGMTGQSRYEGEFPSPEAAKEHADGLAKRSKKFMAYELWTGTADKPGKFVEYLFGRKKGDKINPKTNTWESESIEMNKLSEMYQLLGEAEPKAKVPKPLKGKKLDAEINRLFKIHGDRIQFDIFDLGKIANAGKQAAETGGDIEQAIKDAVAQYRKN